MVITQAALTAVTSQGAAPGLRFVRHFTADGVHPYDEIEWELRDAVIKDWRTGGIAFEQRDVEFPVSWSQNATTIVSQKYFRGTPGTPQREHSVRQMIDRVADTIARWGRADGYFADDASAEVFTAELKHVLVTQKAAFNSPVWFNCGVEETPQCSACFILSVEDTMGSILNWYVEEGTIFKGGSGSGVNLSRIRSSKERLRGGGEASGPVSFMRGADASAGTIKCLHADTDIPTDSGVLPIARIQPGSRVLTRHGYHSVAAVHDNGVQELVRVRTALGDDILCTPEHRFWVRGADGEGWREARHLRADDYLLIDLGATDFGTTQSLMPVSAGHHNEISHSLPETLDEAFGLWLGWIYGDGSITTREAAKFIAIQLGDADSELIGRYTALTRTLFGEQAHISSNRHSDRPDASASVRFCSSQVIRFLEANGLRKAACHELRVPQLVKSSPATVRAAFLSGLFEADGHVGNGYPWLSTVNADFAVDVHRLLLSIGIPSTIGQITDRKGAFGTKPMHTVRVVGGAGVERFAKLVGFISERKSDALAASLRRRASSPFEMQWMLPHAGDELQVVWQLGTPELKRAVAPYTRYTQRRTLSLLRARALLEAFPEAIFSTCLSRFALGQDFYVSATVEPADRGPTCDLTVEGVHEYLVHNLVTHNSGGKTRRAAKMVILDVDHPDIEEFIWCKQREELKARALREAGFDMDLDGLDSGSIQYQNANNSVRVTDEFMQAVEADADFALKAVLTGEDVTTLRARDLMRQIAQAAWECADPGMQYDTTINDWHTTPNAGRINGSNPCFPADAKVHTDKGLVRFDELVARVNVGESFGVYTHDATNVETPAERVELTTPEAFLITGRNPILRLRFSSGAVLRCTPGHKIFTTNRGYVAAEDLTASDQVKVLNVPTPAVTADMALPVSTHVGAYRQKGDHARLVRLPEKWTDVLGHYLGYLTGDGSVSGNVLATTYGTEAEQAALLPRHQALLAWLNGDVEPKPSRQDNGTVQLRLSRRILARFFTALGVSAANAADKRVPASVFAAPTEMVASYLRGLFDADGCVVDNVAKGHRYVRLGSASEAL
ncbi:MAG: hypothetical protein M3387_13050, partial [Actinomycetota bacterium]|nr:hypothetical protein [Actinomycetota bacterium]